MRSSFVSNGLMLVAVLSTSMLPVLGLLTEQDESSTSLDNTIETFHETRSLNGDFTVRYSQDQKRDLDENAPLPDGLEKRKGGGGGHGGGGGRAGGGGRGGGGGFYGGGVYGGGGGGGQGDSPDDANKKHIIPVL